MNVRDKLRRLGKRSGRGILYAATLPERLVRSASALSAGVVHEVAQVVVPIGVRRGRLYRNLVDVTLRFLLENVGGVHNARPTDEQLGNDFLLRRTAGNGIELVGIVAFRASPVWVLAALADICGIGRQLIPEIAKALQEEGLLARETSFTTMDQLLQGLERSSAQLAETINTPPLDVAGLRREWAKIAAETRQLPRPQLPSTNALSSLWQELRSAAANEQRTVFEVSSLLALSAVGELPEKVRVLSKSAAVALRRSGTVLSAPLLEHYRLSLLAVQQAGFVGYGVQQLAPYTHAALAAFSPERTTLTGKLLDKL